MTSIDPNACEPTLQELLQQKIEEKLKHGGVDPTEEQRVGGATFPQDEVLTSTAEKANRANALPTDEATNSGVVNLESRDDALAAANSARQNAQALQLNLSPDALSQIVKLFG